MRQQSTSQIVMIRPHQFGYNDQTAVNNAFQSQPDSDRLNDIHKLALIEFDQMVQLLQLNEVVVHVIQDQEEPHSPDAIFPNNWFTTHDDGSLITYPMFAPNRRAERSEEVISYLASNYTVSHRYSFEQYEAENLFLEGTGSMILDRQNKIVYACLSERTNITLLDRFCLLRGYEKIVFHAQDETEQPIYHTNVMMAVGSQFAVVCLDCISDKEEKELVRTALNRTGKGVVEITEKQMNSYAGNMLELQSTKGETLILMSHQARKSLTKRQVKKLNDFGKIIAPDIRTIEEFGGGSVRCMVAEIFLPAQKDL